MDTPAIATAKNKKETTNPVSPSSGPVFVAPQILQPHPHNAAIYGVKSPRMHILAKSDRYVQLRETGEIIGNYETPEGRAKYEQMNADPKKPATLRSFYVIFLLDENNQGLHTVPLVLSLHGVAAARFGEAYNQFKVQMEIAYAKAMQTGYRSLNEKFHCLAVFNPTFKPSLEPPTGDKKSWVAIPETVAVPDENSPIGKFLALDKQAEIWALAGEAASFSKHLLKAADVVDDTMANAVCNCCG